MLEYEIENLIASLKYEIKALDKEKKDKKRKEELTRLLSKIISMYEEYKNSDEQNKEEISVQLKKYLRTPKVFLLISKYRRLIATAALLGILTPLSSCKFFQKEEPVIPEPVVVIKKHLVTFLDEEGNIIKQEEIADGRGFPRCEIEEKYDYDFIGWESDNKIYEYGDIVDKDLTLKPKFCGPKSKRPEFYNKLNALIDGREGLVYVSKATPGTPYIIVNDFSEFLSIYPYIKENISLLERVDIELNCLTIKDLKMLSTFPKEFTYTDIALFSVSEDEDLKSLLMDLKVNGITLASGNISSEDLKYILHDKQASFNVYSEDFDKFEEINEYANNEDSLISILTIKLNKHANNKEIVLPKYDIIFLEGNEESKNAHVTCSSTLVIKYTGSEFLDISCQDDTDVAVSVSLTSINDTPIELMAIEDILSYIGSNPIFQKLKNVDVITININDIAELYIKKENKKRLVVDENNIVLGEISIDGFKGKETEPSLTLQK